MKNQLIFISLLVILSAKAHGGTTLYCSHPELCRMINQVSNFQTESLVSISGDPHEYEPSAMEIKKLISAPVLITGPNELNPWMKKINFQRSKIPNLRTITILFDQKDYQTYSHANEEALSHFWLYPKIYCSLKNKLETELQKLKFLSSAIRPCEFKKMEDELRSTLTKIKKPIILTHDALLPLLLNLGANTNNSIVAIKGSGHHEEANPESIKKMYDARDSSPQVIWIQETGITISQNIINKIRPNDIIIKIDTATSNNKETFSVLNELRAKLALYGQK